MASMSAIRIIYVSGGFKHLGKPKPLPNFKHELDLNDRLKATRGNVMAIDLYEGNAMAIDLPTTAAATLTGSCSSSRTHPHSYDRPQTPSQETSVRQCVPEMRITDDLSIHQVRRCAIGGKLRS